MLLYSGGFFRAGARAAAPTNPRAFVLDVLLLLLRDDDDAVTAAAEVFVLFVVIVLLFVFEFSVYDGGGCLTADGDVAEGLRGTDCDAAAVAGLNPGATTVLLLLLDLGAGAAAVLLVAVDFGAVEFVVALVVVVVVVPLIAVSAILAGFTTAGCGCCCCCCECGGAPGCC